MKSYKVKLRAFEGPFDLLVYLIEHNKMSIYDIEVSEITAQYLSYLEEATACDIEIAQDFLVLAAELIAIKSAMLLPRDASPSGEAPEEDPRSELVSRILEYRQFKEMADFLADQEELMQHVHTKPSEDLTEYTGEAEELLKTDEEQFAKAFLAFLHRKKRIEEMHRTYERIERVKVSMESRITQMKDILKFRPVISFSEMVREDNTPFNRVITFMSLLELLKQNEVTAEQKKRFGDIRIERSGQ